MKKLILPGISILSIFIVVLIHSCKKQDVYRVIKISTDTIANISDTTALVFGTIIDAGDGITQHGHCWSTNEDPTISDNFVDNGETSETGEFTSTLKGLVPGTVYYIKAYASDGTETIYGEQKFFSSGKGLPKLSITRITNINKASATCEVNITSDGGETILTKGLVWGINSNPVIGYSDGFSTEEGDLSSFTSDITSVSPESTIYVRAYASNENGIAYSQQQEITMLPAEAGDFIWANNFGKYNADAANYMGVDSEENLYLTGTFKSTTINLGEYTLNNSGDDDIFLAKFNSDGEVLWATSAEGSGKDRINGLAVDGTGNVYLLVSSSAVAFDQTILPYSPSYVAKYNPSGQLVWAKGFANSCGGIACDAGGNFYLTGEGDAANFTTKKSRTKAVYFGPIYVAKFDPNGNFDWGKNIGNSTFGTGMYFYSDLCLDQNENVFVTGNYHGDFLVNGTVNLLSSGQADIYVAKYSNNGIFQWAGKGASTGNDYAMDISSGPNGEVYLTGYFTGSSLTFDPLAPVATNGQKDLFIAKYNANGSADWVNVYGGPNDEFGTGVSTDASGNVYLSGSFSSNELIIGSETIVSRGESDVLIVKISDAGQVEWTQSAGSVLFDEGNCVASSAEHIYLGGRSEGPVVYFDYFELPYFGLTDLFISKLKQ